MVSRSRRAVKSSLRRKLSEFCQMCSTMSNTVALLVHRVAENAAEQTDVFA
jgi:hypothetical protein